MDQLANVGISGFAAFVPPYRVSLESWCAWNGSSWEKTRAVIGRSFRVPGPQRNVYTMAADAVLKLLLEHDVDPRRVGYLAVGTESGSDNATSAAVVVRGLVDQALLQRGLPPLARDIEAPEIKQACLGGIYGLKGALRYLACDGVGRQAIVVAADVAEYALGSSGEPTQGAGAVAMLLEAQPRLLTIDLRGAANSSAYRALDFRKPFSRYCGQTPGADGRPRDFPLFNGKYSTACYIDATMASMDAYLARRSGARAGYLRSLGAVFMHRPYHRMPMAAWTLGYLFALGADGGAGHTELVRYCAAAEVELEDVLAEMRSDPGLLVNALRGDLVEEPYPLTARLAKAMRTEPELLAQVEGKLSLGAEIAKDFGNLYSASLPAWLAAGLEEAAQRGLALDGHDLLLIGYGSGDASEVLPARVVPGWQASAARTRIGAALADAIDIDRAAYEALHEGGAVVLPPVPVQGFHVARVGSTDTASFQDLGIEYYHCA